MLRLLSDRPLDYLAEIADGLKEDGLPAFAVDASGKLYRPVPSSSSATPVSDPLTSMLTAEFVAMRSTLAQIAATSSRMFKAV
ncbi:hypothetical protein M0802_012023 [Mischocyttarus mexicanus]|nr:hypothetical protein M0802_012023 [Mischocyttarus mexicanus]